MCRFSNWAFSEACGHSFRKKNCAIFFEFEEWAEQAAVFQPGVFQEFLMEQSYLLFSEKGK
jgi:hypothetical protein